MPLSPPTTALLTAIAALLLSASSSRSGGSDFAPLLIVTDAAALRFGSTDGGGASFASGAGNTNNAEKGDVKEGPITSHGPNYMREVFDSYLMAGNAPLPRGGSDGHDADADEHGGSAISNSLRRAANLLLRRHRGRGGAGFPSSRSANDSSAVRSNRSPPDGHAAAFGTDPNPVQPAAPVIAMVPSPMSDCNSDPNLAPPAGYTPTGCVSDYYVRWLQAQGVRVIPMSHSWPTEKKIAMMDQVNGVIMLGGGLDGLEREYYTRNMSAVIKYAQQTPGFLLWGTCQGFQVIGIIINNMQFEKLTCDYVGTNPSMLPLDFTAYQPDSTLFSGAFAEMSGIVRDAKDHNTTLNWHNCGIAPENFHPSDPDFKVISTNVDLNNKPFVSSYEAVTNGKNIFAVQYHPERPPMQFTSDAVAHDQRTIDVSTYHARFIAQRLKLNSHTFGSQSQLNVMTIDNFPHRYVGWGSGFYWVNI